MTDELLEERGKTHGDWATQSTLSQALKGELDVAKLEPFMTEALDMICVKISRICAGNPSCIDHWEDISGYATLVAKEIKSRIVITMDDTLSDYFIDEKE